MSKLFEGKEKKRGSNRGKVKDSNTRETALLPCNADYGR
jgi:hypothetical protein